MSGAPEPRPAALARASEPPLELVFEEPAREAAEVSPPVPDEEPRLHETPVEVPRASEERAAERLPVDWPARIPLEGLHEASWRSPRPVVAEVEPVAPPAPPAPASDPVSSEPAEVGEAVVDEPVALESPAPAYPRKARRLGWEGTVELRMRVDAGGRVLYVELLESSGHAVLDAAAIEGLKRWVFRARQPGDPLVRVFRKPFRFSLD